MFPLYIPHFRYEAQLKATYDGNIRIPLYDKINGTFSAAKQIPTP